MKSSNSGYEEQGMLRRWGPWRSSCLSGRAVVEGQDTCLDADGSSFNLQCHHHVGVGKNPARNPGEPFPVNVDKMY